MVPFHLSSVRFKKTFYKGKRSAFPNLFFFFFKYSFRSLSTTPPPSLGHCRGRSVFSTQSCGRPPLRSAEPQPPGGPAGAGSRAHPPGPAPPGPLPQQLGPGPASAAPPPALPPPGPARPWGGPQPRSPLHSPLLSSCLLLASLRAPARGWRRSDRWVPNVGRICAHPAPVILAEQRGARSWPPSAAFFSPQTRTGSQTWPGWPCCASPGSSAKAAGRRPPAPAAPCHLQHRRGGRTLKRVGSSPLRFVRT